VIVLSLCDRTGIMVEPWAEAGYECVTVDLQTSGDDVRHYLPPRTEYAAVFAFPPCTDLAVSGARWFRGKGLLGLAQALEVVDACRRICEWSGAPWMLENPVSTLSTYWREPDQIFDPYEYGGYLNPPGDAYTKKTCLWTGGGFVMPSKKPVAPLLGSIMHKLPPSTDRGDLRSVTPAGFARAVFEANAGLRPLVKDVTGAEIIVEDKLRRLRSAQLEKILEYVRACLGPGGKHVALEHIEELARGSEHDQSA
jgi:hypothetical protein